MSSLGSDTQENVNSYFNDRLSDKVYTTFKELFSNVNINSICEILPKINQYNNEIGKFVEDINIKYGFSVKYTQLEVSEISTGLKLFK